MKKELENILFEKYKNIFPKGRDVDYRQNLMCFGFVCGDGWYNIIDEFLSRLTLILKREKFTIDIIQIKEKFGSLRIYYNMNDEQEKHRKEVRNILMLAELKSFKTCEICGKDGDIRQDNGWVSTLCNSCVKEKRGI